MKKNIIIVLLVVLSCILVMYSYNIKKQLKTQKQIIETEFIDSTKTYVNLNLDKEISELKKTNKELYDSIKSYKNEISYLSQFKYHKEYVVDTVFVKNINENDTITEFVYKNENKTDSLNYTLRIASEKEPYWYKLNISIDDKFTIVNRKQNEINKTTIESSNGGEINDVTIFNKKTEKFSDRFSHGIIVGGGYGVLNNKFDIFIGYGGTFKF